MVFFFIVVTLNCSIFICGVRRDTDQCPVMSRPRRAMAFRTERVRFPVLESRNLGQWRGLASAPWPRLLPE